MRHHAARHLLPARRDRRRARRRCSGASPTATRRAWAERGRASWTTATVRDRRRRSTPCAPSIRHGDGGRGGVGRRARRRRCTPTSPSSRPRTSSASPPTAARRSRCSPTPALLGERFTAVHATHLDRRRHRRCSAAGRTCCLCPTTERDLADGIGPAPALRRRRRRAVPRLRLARRDRPVRGGPRGRARRAPGHRRARAPRRRRAAARGDGRRLRQPRLAGGRPARGRRARRPRSTVGLDSVRLAGTEPGTPVEAVGLRRRGGRRAPRHGRRPLVVARRRAPSRSTSPASSPRSSAGSSGMTTLVVDSIGLLVTNDPALGDGPLGLVRDAARRDRGRRS